MHRLLARQLKRYLADKSFSPEMERFIKAIDQAYTQADEDLKIFQRSLAVTSEELNERNAMLEQEVEKQLIAQQDLKESLAVLNATFDSTGEAIITFDIDGLVKKYNQPAEAFFELEGVQVPLTVSHFKGMFKVIKDVQGITRDLAHIKADPDCEIFGQFELYTGRIYEYHSLAQIDDGKLYGRVWCFRDVTDLKKSEALVKHQAYHDALTNLPNRILLDDRLQHAVNYSARYGTQVAVLFIDLDDFKKVNDYAGHQAGDQVLTEVSQRIQSCTREIDTLARLGGDEFVVLLENLEDYRIASATSHRIIESLAQPFHIDENDFYISSSIGISVYPKDSDTPDELLRKADMAMYHAKSQGKSNHQYFDAALEQHSLRQMQLERLLRDAIDKKQLSVYYQPKVDLKDGAVTSLEALIRWTTEAGHMILPTEFIPIAEQTGLINQIGILVFERCCQQLAQWQTLGISDMQISLNISPIEFCNKDLCHQLKGMLDKYNVPAKQIELEITESLLLDDMHYAKQVLRQLREMDFSVAIDDFGTGYSSLKYLQQLEIDTLKIDKSFVINLNAQSQGAAIADTIITLAHNLNLKVVAEGVENEKALSFLKERGCDVVQGFYYYKPMPSEQVTAVLLGLEKKSK
ncbi:putative bifunctional diguanylate cyclase/phosphodiesterase [Flocculibacter collagenilyticus]|uniref:putative bifunctional diguanylate cyclase/phosphodiesterase n=1 Tax=Flocculibacter collagenilyticus TaxID=2744479 RepID=UPI0018F36E70|nr:EAL domain-containing protein [Flocculibacter collagenilyticus]